MDIREAKKRKIDEINNEIHDLRSSADLDLAQAIDCIKENIIEAEQINYHEGITNAYRIISILYTYNGEASLALEALNKAEEMCLDYCLDKRLLAEIYNTYVLYYLEVKKNYKMGAKYCSKGLQIARKLQLYDLISKLTMNFGVVCLELGILKESLEYFLESLEIGKMINDKRAILYSYANIADYYYQVDCIGKARDYHSKTILLAEELNDIIVMSSTALGFATIEKGLGNYDQAKMILLESIERLKQNNQKSWEANLSLVLFEHMLEEEDFKDIDTLIYNIREVVLGINNESYLEKFYFLLSNYYEKTKDFKKALECYKLYDNCHAKNLEKKEVESINALKMEMMQTTIKRLKTLSEVGKEIASYNNLTDIFSKVRNLVTTVFDDFNFVIALVEGKTIRSIYYNYLGEEIAPFEISLDNKSSFISYSARSKEVIVLNDLEKEYQNYVDSIKYVADETRVPKSLLSIPLTVFEKVVGVFQIQTYERNVFSTENVEFFSVIASYTGVALRNSMHAMQLENIANEDSLTGLKNWHYFNKTLFEEAHKRKSSELMTLIILDIDHFKKVNDIYGHGLGNKCLQEVSERIDKEFSDIARVVARIGGEEFAVFIIGQNVDLVKIKLWSLYNCFNEMPIELEEVACNVTVSIGVVFTDKSGVNADSLFDAADDALYEAKEAGRNKIIFKKL